VGQGIGVVTLAGLAYCGGRFGPAPKATAVPPAPPQTAAPAAPATDYSRRAVAYIFGNIMISREELGEYLIARQGADRLNFLVNRRIIEHACREKGVTVTNAEVEQALAEDLKSLNVNLKDFESKILKSHQKTLFEWKEDVIRPKLQMRKLCLPTVRVTEEDIKDAFQAYYGEKVKCRMIMFPPGAGQDQIATKVWEKIHDNEDEFARAARQQASVQLAAKAGDIPPIGWHTTGDDRLERAAFRLRPGEVSEVLQFPQGYVILKCDARIPADTTKKLDNERAMLEKEIIEKKLVNEAIPKFFAELQKRANAKLFLQKYRTEEEWLRDIQQELPVAAPQQSAQMIDSQTAH
jgi:parvulin-like peptidyl-prolyl isomerase